MCFETACPAASPFPHEPPVPSPRERWSERPALAFPCQGGFLAIVNPFWDEIPRLPAQFGTAVQFSLSSDAKQTCFGQHASCERQLVEHSDAQISRAADV